MLAVALNYLGFRQEENLGLALIKLFKEFKIVELSPYADSERGRLQLCQPQGYEELMKSIQTSWHSTESRLELRGPKDKLLRTVRNMVYFEEEKKYNQVFLEGGDGFNDFPWAIQIVMIPRPVLGWEYDPEVIGQADIIIINASTKEDNECFSAKAKKIHPDIPFFIEKVQEGLSQKIKDCLETIFADYLEKRARIKAELEFKYPDLRLSCAQARRLAEELEVSSYLVGSVCDELGYRITNCQLGCF
ncbi:MAG TPA: hypothetical protein VN456_08705 [Desulfosporosinus sp.]|nr:hypothetical protein [Desulfosporosinus sp.]